MRPIKFRAWIPNDIAIWLTGERKEVNGKETSAHMRYDISAIHFWEDGLPIQTAFRPENTTLSGMRRDTENPIVLMQFTGLLDKNGKEIYEADLIRDTDNGIEFEVRNNGISFYAFVPAQNTALDLVKGESCYEVIGNIYETPELLTAHK